MGDDERIESQNEETSKPGESAEDKFKRLATKRMNNALKKIQLIGNLSGPGYRYSPEQAEKIVQGLRDAISEIEARFAKTSRKGEGFSL